jgi:hypothetical protein
MIFGFACTCGMDLEVDLVVDSAGSPGHYGIPEMSSPGEGAEWHVEKDETCDGCGKVWDNDAVASAFEEQIQERIAEPDEPDDFE